jgi:VIT1/CCC1 family predicted Fe2+/Mn2+ transporter
MNNALWIVQILVALGFTLTGLVKLTQPKEKLALRMGWVNDFSQNNIRVIGLLELLGAVGVIVPALTGILPWLTSLAAVGLIVVMLGAAATHLRRKEYAMAAITVVMGALAAFIAYGRFVLVPLS